jgi:hypothetical protein
LHPQNSLLRHLIAENYTLESLTKIKEELAVHRSHEILPVANGLFAASSSQAPDAVSGYQNVWVRDNVMVAPGQMSSNFSERLDFRDAHLQTDCEAQWCIFDPLLSIIYGERFLADRSDVVSSGKQLHYFNRSLTQLTPAGACPELYFLKHGRYIANNHTPLAWTQANQALALHLMEKSIGEKK